MYEYFVYESRGDFELSLSSPLLIVKTKGPICTRFNFQKGPDEGLLKQGVKNWKNLKP